MLPAGRRKHHAGHVVIGLSQRGMVVLFAGNEFGQGTRLMQNDSLYSFDIFKKRKIQNFCYLQFAIYKIIY